MTWKDITATIPEAFRAENSPLLEIFRAHGVEHTAEVNGTIVGAMPVVDGVDERLADLREDLLKAGCPSVEIGDVPPVDWANDWRRFFHVRRVGVRFVIRPSWEDYEAQPGDRVITLDPGEAFGTGDHPTTRGCLELMEYEDFAGRRVADLGCGSGILSIGAVMLGADEVVASDIDSGAVEVALENARRNNVVFRTIVGDGVRGLVASEPTPGKWEDDEVSGGSKGVGPNAADGLDRQFDIVISNIISAVLIRLSKEVAAILKPGGTWIVSGIIAENWPDVQRAALDAGFHLRDTREDSGWVAAVFRLTTVN